MRKPKKPSRICGDCLHVSACMAWNNGRLYDADATHCVNFQPAAADVRPVVRAEWYGEGDGYADGELVYDMWLCPICGKRFEEWEEKPDWNFCPNCGADMRETNDEKA